MKFRDNKISTARREAGYVRNKGSRRHSLNRAVRHARRLFIEDSAN